MAAHKSAHGKTADPSLSALKLLVCQIFLVELVGIYSRSNIKGYLTSHLCKGSAASDKQEENYR